MRSFIKSHRRTELAASEDPDEAKTPLTSPLVMQTPQFTPPQLVGGASLTSPKRLLTPIKNLFLSLAHSRLSTNIAEHAKSKPDSRKLKHRGHSSVSNISEITMAKHSFELPRVLAVAQQGGLGPPPNLASASTPQLHLTFPTSVSYTSLTSATSSASSNARNSTHRPFSSTLPSIPNEHSSDSDDSDSSSQFSFVQDMKGGRNTSVKYYKPARAKEPELPQASNTFSEHDLGYEVDEFSDYDYENNGMDDDDYDDDEDNHYTQIFDDERDAKVRFKEQESSAPGAATDNASDEFVFSSPEVTKEHIQWIPVGHSHKRFNRAYHLSIDGVSEASDSDSDFNTNDILENYLEMSLLPARNTQSSSDDDVAATPELATSETFELYDLSSPIINGLTIGNNLRHRYRADEPEYVSPVRTYVPRSKSSDEIFKLRVLKSFHGSLSETLDVEIPRKVERMTRVEEAAEGSERVKSEESSEVTDVKAGSEEASEVSERGKSEEDKVGLGISPAPSSASLLNARPSMETQSTLLEPEARKRQSVIDMMESLSLLDGSTTEEPTVEVSRRRSVVDVVSTLKQLEPAKRQSVVDMMATLAVLQSTEQTPQSKRKSVADMMATLASLETPGESDTASKRQSVIDMMSSLAALEDQKGSADPKTKGNRQSVVDMMASLSALEAPEVSDAPTRRKGDPRTRLAEGKRYSWFNNDELVSFKTVSHLRTSLSDITGDMVLDEHDDSGTYLDLLDEVNSMTEDFDFDEQKPWPPLEGFQRSNSYKNRPTKLVMDNTVLTNKIETLNKTVTFYRTNSQSSLSKSRSISRAPSARSMLSLNEEEHNPPFRAHSHTGAFRKKNLGTITEADSPLLR